MLLKYYVMPYFKKSSLSHSGAFIAKNTSFNKLQKLFFVKKYGIIQNLSYEKKIVCKKIILR